MDGPSPLLDLTTLLYRFLEWMRVRDYSERTVTNRYRIIRRFIDWCTERGVALARQVSRQLLERYQRHLYHYRKPNGHPLHVRTQLDHLVSLRAFFRFLSKTDAIPYNPAADLDLPRQDKRLPRCVLSPREVEAVLSQPDTSTLLGIRDRTILETFYSTGMRRFELVNLELHDVDLERGVVLVHGKGKKDRTVPIGDRALLWVGKYIDDVRPGLLRELGQTRLFLDVTGKPLVPNRLTHLVGNYVRAADLGKEGSCHLLRHSCATAMLENGADTRFIQALLGHANLSTTQIYTQVSIRKLKEVHTNTHPARIDRSLVDCSSLSSPEK